MLRRLFSCFFFSLVLISFCLGAEAGAYKVKNDSDVVKLRSFNPSAMKSYAADRDFHYDRASVSTAPSLWERFWHWFWSLIPDVFSDAKSGGNARYLFIVLGCAAIIFAIIKFIGMDIRSIFTGKAAQVELPYSEKIENIHEISFVTEIEKAVSEGNYRLAVRLLYLQCLKDLNDAGRIKWEIDKTNSQYVQELKHPEQRKQFRDLTRRFEYVWYGNFSVDPSIFQSIRDSFKSFNLRRK